MNRNKPLRTASGWRPTEHDVLWCRDLVASLNEGGTWATTNAIYQINHQTKTLTLIEKLEGYQEELHQRNVIVFGLIGWNVVLGVVYRFVGRNGELH